MDGVRVFTGQDLMYEIMNNGYEPISLTVKRGGVEIVLPDVRFPVVESEGVVFGSSDFFVYAAEKNFGNVMTHAFFRSTSTVKMIMDQIGDMLRGRYGLNAMSGPVGVTGTMVEVAQADATSFLYLVMIITINLGVFNLLPIPALDGGRLLFLVIEAITGKPVNPKVEGFIHFIGMIALLALMVIVTGKDIFKFFR